ncbi:MAG: cytochrome-c oxidase, cbb3-type subunit I [Sandaracinaceae bacterium]|nr:cytochrome-c oxidase, cbb3-type subunit I [Sandaracinaceae bacterium]
MQTQRIVYNDKVVRQFIFASVAWGIVGMTVGAIVATQLAVWQANVGPWLTFGRLRPLHTNAVIFAFVGNMMFAGIYHSMQRLLKTRLASDTLSQAHFWGWQLIILSAAITLPLGITQSKEYAELEWPIDLMVAVVWVVFAINFFWTLAKRNEKHLYVAIWFYISTVVTITVLYVVNNLAIPAGLFRSYSVFAGVQDALVQWWYGHNAVAFFLTTPILGIMYYYVPKAAERPVFSYRLSIVHFWGLVFLYIWAGPHHLLNTALPEWAQTLGMVFSLMLWAPSWGGMLNGLLTLRGAWDKLRSDPVLKFFAAAVTFYGMSTFEGPLLSIRSVSALGHYTDWIIGHAHGGALGWNGFMAAGMFYWLVPRMYGTKLHSQGAANFHFYLGTFGILLYMVAMWISGVTQGLMWRAENEDGGLLYVSFLETIDAIRPMYWMRLTGGTMYLIGMIMMGWNLLMTIRGKKAVESQIDVVVEEEETPRVPWTQVVLGKPVLVTAVVAVLLAGIAYIHEIVSTVLLAVATAAAVGGAIYIQSQKGQATSWHRLLEGRGLVFTVFVTIAILIGGIAELLPTIVISTQERSSSPMQPYSALELEGRDVYISEGCYTCHSQMIRPFTWESSRYGAVSTANDSVWDHPFQWGSKRNGPDLAREGGRNSNVWHYKHMIDPRETSHGSLMPSYAHLRDTRIDFDALDDKLGVMRMLGVPYQEAQVRGAPSAARQEALSIATDLRREVERRGAPEGVGVPLEESALVALIADLQRLGRNQPTFQPESGEGGVEVSQATDRAASAEVQR